MKRALLAFVACAGTASPPAPAPTPAPARAPQQPQHAQQPPPPQPAPPPATAPATPATAPPAPAPTAERWLRGSTHVHARPSGDSTTPIADVIRWYESRGYDFIALTDHNRISEVAAAADTTGQIAVRAPAAGLIVLSGIELTYNPARCTPPGDATGRCRIHVNLLGPTARPRGKIAWGLGQRLPDDRLAKYQAALDLRAQLGGGLAQINHPQWHRGMTADLLAQLARRGARLVEIANVQFAAWDRGDATYPSTEALWDRALATGVTLWGVASDDAHSYGEPGGRWPAGGGWVAVRARRDPQAILAALEAGRFYASTGVVLERAEVTGGELVVEVAPGERQGHTIELVENGVRVAAVRDRIARRALPPTGYLRAVVVRDDGARAWVQPQRR